MSIQISQTCNFYGSPH